MKPARPITDEVLAALRDDPRTDHALAKASGVDAEVLRRFRSRERDSIKLATLDQLAPALGLRLVRSKARAPRPPREGS